ncbi:hypothetical protein Goarm_017916 [Gossypium armourianum]|uniref:Uncharacterized protein n=1 Tax=Gossypium armourianum TaxID=34283 RepID=A0A7J9IHG7_9ROSI|nr:hypothetical protein [Gossypium armourianum]
MKFGGLGIQHTQMKNDALLAKQAWKLVTKPQGFTQSILLAKDFTEQNFLQVQARKAYTWTWKSILCGVAACRGLGMKGFPLWAFSLLKEGDCYVWRFSVKEDYMFLQA